jgi:hypothetical protein
MKLIAAYLIAALTGLTYLLVTHLIGELPTPLSELKVGITCSVIGGIGGCIYCLRAVYLNACVRQQWNDVWKPWYYIRPIVSVACGGVSYLFLRAGLLILESGSRSDSTDLGFYALAFIAGLNVDKFISKIEDVAQAVWGIEKSRSSSSKPSENQ